jgi:hypothetical protein
VHVAAKLKMFQGLSLQEKHLFFFFTIHFSTVRFREAGWDGQVERRRWAERRLASNATEKSLSPFAFFLSYIYLSISPISFPITVISHLSPFFLPSPLR